MPIFIYFMLLYETGITFIITVVDVIESSRSHEGGIERIISRVDSQVIPEITVRVGLRWHSLPETRHLPSYLIILQQYNKFAGNHFRSLGLLDL